MNKYEILNNALKITPKNDSKDRIEVELGDSKQPDKFYQQLKVMRWDNECNVSVRLVDDEPKTQVEEDGKIKLKGKSKEVHLYELYEGFEFEVILKEKPATNVIEFTLEDKDVVYYYQPELTQKEKDEGAVRPDNVIGSYAVYAKTPKTNYIDGKEYKIGKIGHIYRPRIEDAEGKGTWGVLNIENKKLTVTIPQEFLDAAVYPIRHASGLEFGYHTIGETVYGGTLDVLMGSLYVGVAGTGVSMSFYHCGTPETLKYKMAIYDSSHALVTNSSTDEGTASSTGEWATENFATAPTLSAVNYVLVAWYENMQYVGTRIYYDTGSANQGHELITNYTGTFPTSPTFTHSTKKCSIYVTYTASGSTVVQDIIGGGIVPFPR